MGRERERERDGDESPSLLIKEDLGKVGGGAFNAHQSIPHFPMHVNEGNSHLISLALICAKHSKDDCSGEVFPVIVSLGHSYICGY